MPNGCRWTSDDEGVSPVMGVIMTVAMVVGLAAVVFVVGGGFSKSPGGTTPQVTFTKMSSALQVVTAPNHPYLDWNDLDAKGTCAPHLMLTSLGGAPGLFPPAAGTLVSPGDQLSNCALGETLTLSHRATNTVIYTFNF